MSRTERHLHRHTYADYLAVEEASNTKHEYFDGEIYAMVGGTPSHAALAVAISAALFEQLRGRACRVFSSDLRVRVPATGLATHPDVTVVCGALERDPESYTTVVNPTLVVEVTSDGTEDYDRGEKFDHYKQLPSLRECVVASHREPRLEVWRREPDGSWSHRSATQGQVLRLESLGCELSADDVYRVGLEDV